VPVERVVACIDARMGEVYHAGYRRDKDRWRVCSPPALYAVDAIPVLNGSGWFGVGSGFAEYGARLRARQPLAAEFPWLRPHARNIAGLARTCYGCGEMTSAACALPVYLREKVALTMRERSDERHTAT
jgi:tRNA threonylcarbamoyladenosine biosynthesis protein TsaB